MIMYNTLLLKLSTRFITTEKKGAHKKVGYSLRLTGWRRGLVGEVTSKGKRRTPHAHSKK